MPRTPRGAITLAEEQPRSPRHRRLVAVLVVVVLAAWSARPRCSACGTCAPWCRASSAWSRHPARRSRGPPTRRATPPRSPPSRCSAGCRRGPRPSPSPPPCRSRRCATSKFGDRDSLGLFQQRPSQGWGTAEQILDPEYSTNKFYDALEKIKGYASMDIAQAAQKVQRSAAGEAYAQHEAQARVTASVLSGQTHGGMVCALKDPATPGDPGEVAALVEKDFGSLREGGEEHGHRDGGRRRPGLGGRRVGRRAGHRHRRHPRGRRQPGVATRHVGLGPDVAHRGCRTRHRRDDGHHPPHLRAVTTGTRRTPDSTAASGVPSWCQPRAPDVAGAALADGQARTAGERGRRRTVGAPGRHDARG